MDNVHGVFYEDPDLISSGNELYKIFGVSLVLYELFDITEEIGLGLEFLTGESEDRTI